MAKKKIKKGVITKTVEPKPTNLIVQELNIMSADRSRKDIGDIKQSLISAESVHYPNRTRLYDLYNDVVLDGCVTGVMEKRYEAILNKNLYFEDASGTRLEDMDDVIESQAFRDVIKQIMEAQAYGISGMEFIPGEELCFKEIPRKHIKPENKIIAYEQNDNAVGVNYEGVSNLWVVGNEKDLGYLLKCSFYAVYKRGGLGDYAQYIEIFGQPVRIIYYDANDQKTRAELRRVLDESGSSLAMMVPNQAKFEMMDGKSTNANGELQLKFLNYLDEEISIIVLGNTETTRSSSSSGYAQSKEHNNQQVQKTKSDLKYVKSMLNSKQFLAILKSYGLPVDGGKFKWEKEINPEELKTKAETLKTVREALPELPVDDDWVYKTFDIEKPANYEALKAKNEADRQAALNPPAADPANRDPANPKPKPAGKPAPSDLRKKLGAWDNLLAHIADFFDQAR
jgi:phage gp29-like protein